MVGRILIALSILLLLPFQAGAEDQGHLEIESRSEVEVTVQNDLGQQEVVRIDAATANVTPGDTVIFTNRYVNWGDKLIGDVVVTNPVPEHMTYIGNSAEGKGTKVEFSIDGGSSYASPEKLIVTGDDGNQRLAGPDEYTHIRWVLEKPIEPGGSGEVSFRAKVN
jgi:uncharacterized repeat protein (TIGR01451 family)